MRLGPGRALVALLQGAMGAVAALTLLGSEQAPQERAAGDPSEGGQARQPALQRADVRPLPAEPGPGQPQGQHLPGLQPLGVSGLPHLRPQQRLALQSLLQGGVSTRAGTAACPSWPFPSPTYPCLMLHGP